MSYCRFSSDDWRSDVYVYEGATGFVIDIAGRRYAPHYAPCPPLGDIRELTPDQFLARINAQREWCQRTPLQPIGHPLAGECFIEGDADSCARRLLFLRDEGFHVPQYAIDALLWESAAG